MKVTSFNNIDFLLSVAMGNEEGFKVVHKFGENPDIDAGSYEDVWEQGGSYTYPATAITNYISSSDNNDTEEVIVIGLDSDWNEQSQLVTLQGQTKTEIGSGLTWIRVFRAYNDNGSDLTGIVYIYEDDTVTDGVPQTVSKIKAVINNGNNQTQMATYSIPNGKTGYILSAGVSLSKKKDGLSNVKLMSREFGKVFRVRDFLEVSAAGTSAIDREYHSPIEIQAKSDIKIMADSSVSGSGVASSFCLLIRDN